MRSSSGEHYLALDHVRAVAVFMVFTWHFINQVLVPYDGAPAIFPLALLDEGHTGVSLFMTLSGYLFAKLLDGRAVKWGAFFWNRFLRLAPMLAVMFVLVGVQKYFQGADMAVYLRQLALGVFWPPDNKLLPHASWSVPIEVHFYLLLPVLLFALRRWRFSLLLALACSIALRAWIWHKTGEVQSHAYWTLVGRMDQFLGGMLAFQFRHLVTGRHAMVVLMLLAYCAFYWLFDLMGGFYRSAARPPLGAMWIFLPAVEGAAYGLAIAYYDGSFKPRYQGLSRFVGMIGVYSYSIYLLHVFVTRAVGKWVRESHVLDFWNFYAALPAALLVFLCMMPVGYLAFRFIEAPFLRLRRLYVAPR